jgi:ABC-type glycerol-3-phosphate transport system substrate-binding protein
LQKAMKKCLSVLLVLAGCLGSMNHEKGETVTIKMWTHDDLYRQFLQKRIDM